MGRSQSEFKDCKEERRREPTSIKNFKLTAWQEEKEAEEEESTAPKGILGKKHLIDDPPEDNAKGGGKEGGKERETIQPLDRGKILGKGLNSTFIAGREEGRG